MIALTVAEGVRVCMSYQVYNVEDKVFVQKAGGSIGLKLSGRKKMIALTVAEGVRVCMSNQDYNVEDKVFVQKAGGPIKLELSGAVIRALL